MDHLVVPTHPHCPVRCRYVPLNYRSRSEPPSNNFFHFDNALGFKFTRVLRGHYDNGLAPGHLEGIFQAWLYFSLLGDIFHPDLDVQDFICHDPSEGTDYLTTSCLRDHIERWHFRHKCASESSRNPMREHTSSVLRAASYLLNRMVNAVSVKFEPVRLISHEFELAARVLIQTLEFELLPDDLPRQRVNDEHGTKVCPMLTQRLLDSHWCPNQVNMLAHTLDIPSFYYATLLGPDLSGKDHSACTELLCKAHQIDQATYRTAHVTTDCKCDVAGAHVNELASLVDDEQVPVIKIVSNASLEVPEVIVQKLTEKMRYVAISHVWADGLGNTDANALPFCQLQRLSDYVEKILPEAPIFWCDTRCVPTEPRELRRKAIWKMRDVYEKAYAVLIIDASLSNASMPASAEEILMRVTCSGWMRRLWTFQENILAKKLFAIFADGMANIDQAESNVLTRERGKPITASSYKSSIGLEASVFYRAVLPGEEKRVQNSSRYTGIDIGSVWESVQWRMTSWPSDEPICLATALDLDLRMILDTVADERMRRIFSCLSGWPPYLIFATFDRMTEQGWRWAPRTLMHPNSMAAAKMHHMNASTKWHREGLIVEFPGFVVDMTPFWAGNAEPRSAKVDFSSAFFLKERVSATWYSCFRDDQVLPSFGSSELPIQGLRQPAVIVSCPIEALSPREKATPQLWDGLVVDVKRHEDGVYFSEYIVKILIGVCPPLEAAEIEEDFAAGRVQNDRLLTLALSDVRRSPDQKWCIG